MQRFTNAQGDLVEVHARCDTIITVRRYLPNTDRAYAVESHRADDFARDFKPYHGELVA
jgi:hypothetical protein